MTYTVTIYDGDRIMETLHGLSWEEADRRMVKAIDHGFTVDWTRVLGRELEGDDDES